jgi:hypothetical protein
MSFPPAILNLRVASPRRRTFRLWLPVFLLWPLLLAFGLLALVFTLLADAVLLAAGRRYHHYSLLLFRLFEATVALRGLAVKVNGPRSDVHIVFL